MLANTKPIVFFDLETTGTNIDTDRIVSFCFVKIDNGTTTEYSANVNPEMPIPAEATAVHKITNEMVTECATMQAYAPLIVDFIGDADLAGYNIDAFDVPILLNELLRFDVELDMTNRRTIDAFLLECKLMPRDLSSVYERYMQRPMTNAHNASSDVFATIDILTQQIVQRQLPTDLDELVSLYSKGVKYLDTSRKIYANEDGVARWAFGKHKDKALVDTRGYADWVLASEFSKSTKAVIRNVFK